MDSLKNNHTYANSINAIGSLRFIAFGCLILFLFGGQSIAEMRITEFSIVEGNLRLVVEDAGGTFDQFTLQTSTELKGGTWAALPGITGAKMDDTHYLFTVPYANLDKEFFRVVGSFLAPGLDPDGDGLPEALETLLGTNTQSFDTDNDGVSDGVEFSYGTNPTDAGDVPDFTTLPRAEFAEASSVATEGSGPHSVTIVFDKPYVGDVKFQVLQSSTANPNVDFVALPTTLAVSGSTVQIPISWIDDDQISPDRVLFLEILSDDNLPYSRGGQTRHTVLLGENDAWWVGVLANKYDQRNFRLRLLHNNGVTRADFVAGANIDGLPTLPGETAESGFSNQSVGVVPEGVFPAIVQSDTAEHFKVVSPPLPAATGGLLGPVNGLSRTLTLESEGSNITPARMVGIFRETLSYPNQNPSVEQMGTVVLVKQLPARPNIIQ